MLGHSASRARVQSVAVDVESLYRRYGPMVLRRCRKMLVDPQQAQDAMQDVFVQMVRRQDILDDRACSSLLYRTATNVCLNKLRTQRRKPASSDTDMLARIANATEESSRGEARSLLDRLFSREPGSTATIAVLHLCDGLTLEETAQEVGMSVSGVRKRLRKLRERLQTMEGAA